MLLYHYEVINFECENEARECGREWDVGEI
jgi:hypothetical protein